MSFPKYPKYKDSGVRWLGRTPEHWDVVQSRRLFCVRNEKPLASDKQVTASQQYGILYQEEFVAREGRKVVETIMGTNTLRRVRPNDFVISLRSFQGGLEWSRIEGSITFHYVVLTPLKHVYEPFFAHLFKSIAYIQALRSTTNLIRDGQDLRFSHFVQVDLPIIPFLEQRDIATFLDRETAKIDALIAEQQRLIELLQEKRQAVISHAVTKGLNPDAPMKDSGIEWLGEVPEHWKTGRCRFYVDMLSGFAFPSQGFSDDEADWRLLRGINVGVGSLRWEDIVYWKREPDDGLDSYEMRQGDLVIGMDRPLISDGMRVARLSEQDVPSLLLQRVVRLTPLLPIDAEYLQHLLSSEMFVAHFAPETTGVSVPHISPDQIAAFVIPVPPIDEQKAILKQVSNKLAALAGLMNEVRQSVDLLQERRSALISAAVTGQIDVRGLAGSEAA
jgi:type I restriction enzyme S subunit